MDKTQDCPHLFWAGKVLKISTHYGRALVRQESDSWRLISIRVHPELRGQGLGSELLRLIIAECARIQAQPIRATATPCHLGQAYRPDELELEPWSQTIARLMGEAQSNGDRLAGIAAWQTAYQRVCDWLQRYGIEVVGEEE